MTAKNKAVTLADIKKKAEEIKAMPAKELHETYGNSSHWTEKAVVCLRDIVLESESYDADSVADVAARLTIKAEGDHKFTTASVRQKLIGMGLYLKKSATANGGNSGSGNKTKPQVVLEIESMLGLSKGSLESFGKALADDLETLQEAIVALSPEKETAESVDTEAPKA